MKKIFPVFMVSFLVLGTIILWFFSSKAPMSVIETGQFAIIILLVGFAVYLGITRLRSVKRGEPAEDELSKRVLQKASSLAYYVSLYLWVAMIFVNDRTKIETEVLLGIGILGMAVIWVALVIFFKVKGLKDE